MSPFNTPAPLARSLLAVTAVILTIDPALAQATGFDLFSNPRGRGFGYEPPNLFYIRGTLIALSGGAGFILGWFLSPQAAEFRKAVLLTVSGLLFLVAIVDNGWLGWGLTPFVSLAAFMGGLGYWLGQRVSAFAERLSQTPTTFGSAAWASFLEVMQAGLVAGVGLRLGYIRNDANGLEPLSYPGDRHMLTLAPSRSGKGTSVIIPNLLSYEGSMVVIDPKGENAMITARHRKEMGQEIIVVDPWSITGLDVACLNPIDWLKPGDVDIADKAMILASAIIQKSTGGSGDAQFFNDEATSYLYGELIDVATAPQEDGRRHLGRVRDRLLMDGDDLQAHYMAMLDSTNAVVRSFAARQLQKDPKLLSNVLASVQAQTHFLDSPRLRESLSRSDFSFGDLKRTPMTVYLACPANKMKSHGKWLAVLIELAISINAENIEDQPDLPVQFILDEMPTLGRLDSVETAFGLMAGFGMQIHAVAQDASQLKRLYGDGWESFVSNAGVIQYMGSADHFTSDYISKLCGVTTVWDWSTAVARAVGVSSSSNGGSSNSSTTDTDTASGKQRQLAYPDELRRMHDTKQILLIERHNPIIAEKVHWFEDPVFKDLGVNLRAKPNQKLATLDNNLTNALNRALEDEL
jgi:type IV secretion system protein VirD4